MKLGRQTLIQAALAVAFAALFLGVLQDGPGRPLAQAASYMYEIVAPAIANDGTGN